MEQRIVALEVGLTELRSAIGRIEDAQRRGLEELTDLRRSLKEDALPDLRGRLAAMDGALREKPSSKDLFQLVLAVFGFVLILIPAVAGAFAWLRRGGVI
jgi:hypothetical protein